jgi:uncharacterized protein (TIGR02453 family)
MEFHGFGPRVFDWFEGLERENTRDYFTRTRALFDAEVRGGMEALLDALAEEFGGGTVKVFRQHRDLRFSPDKSPYKTRTYGVVSDVPELGRGGYAAISSAGLYAGTGYYGMARDQLDRYRAAIDSEGPGEALAAVVSAVEAAGLEVEGEALATAPRGYPRDHPRIELLRRKWVIAGRRIEPGARGIGRDEALAGVGGAWRAAAPLVAWLDQHVGRSELPPEGRGRRR